MKSTVAVITLMLTTVGQHGQRLSSSAIVNAIKQGTAGHLLQATCTASGVNVDQDRSPYTIVVAGPLGRVMAAAKTAAKASIPFSADNATPEMLAPTLTVDAEPVTPLWVHVPSEVVVPLGFPDSFTRVQLKSTSKKDQKPATLEALPDSLSTFDLRSFRGMPDADIEIVLITNADPSGGYSCKISAKNRTLLR